MSQINPDLIAVGLSQANRETIAPLLALFTNADLPQLLRSQAIDLLRKWDQRGRPPSTDPGAFEERLQLAASEILKSSSSDAQMRLQLWMHLRNALDLDPAITFSSIGMREICLGFGTRTPEVFAEQMYEEEVRGISILSKEYWTDHAAQRLNPFSKRQQETLGFDAVVRQIALRTLAGAAERGELPEDVQSELLDRIRGAVEGLDTDARKRLFDEVGIDALSDSAALKILLGGGGLAGLGIAVELGGFAAYILAAKASAIIPLVGGKTLVSTLAVLANPLFVIPALILGGGAISRSTIDSLHKGFAPTVVATLVLNALGKNEVSAQGLIDIFRNLPKHLPEETIEEWKAGSTKQNESDEHWTIKSRKLWKLASRWSAKQVWAEPFPSASAYLELYERLGGTSA